MKRLIAMVSVAGKSPEVVAAELSDAWERFTAASAAADSAHDGASDDSETLSDTVR